MATRRTVRETAAPLELTPGTFAAGAGCAIALLLVLSTISMVLGAASDGLPARVIEKAFSLDREENLPTFASFILIVFAASLVARSGWRQYRAGSRWSVHWFALAAILIFVAYDEAAQVHERANAPMRELLNLGSSLYFAWVIPGIIVVAVLAIAFLPFVRALPDRVRNLVCLGGALYCSGALGIEVVGSLLVEPGAYDGGLYLVAASIEETLEMSGMVTFCTAILTYLGQDSATSDTRSV